MKMLLRRTAAQILLLSALLSAGRAWAGDGMAPPKDPDWEAHKPTWCCRQPDSISAGTLGAFGGGMMVLADDLELGAATGDELPAPLAEASLRLDGPGWMVGGGFRTSFQGDAGWRIGISLGAFYLGGTELSHDPLEGGVSAELDRGTVVHIAPFFGKAFEGYTVYPYIDLVPLLDVVIADVSIIVDDYGGKVGSARLAAVSFDVAPRVGVLVPLDGDFYLDVGAHTGLFGLERLGGYLAFGTWDDF